MPLFEYACEKCAYKFERLVVSGTKSEVKCPLCQQPATKQFSSFAVGHTVAAAGFNPAASLEPKVCRNC